MTPAAGPVADATGPDARAVADTFGLRGPVGGFEEVDGAWSNRVFRLEVGEHRYAVKQVLDPWRLGDRFARMDEAWRLEQRAIAVGVRAPRPVPNPATGGWRADVACQGDEGFATVRVHRWVDGAPAPTTTASEDLARWCGTTLATLHGLELSPTRPERFPDRDLANVERWPELVDAVARAQVPWAQKVEEVSSAVRDIGDLLRARTEPQDRMSHRDIDQKNLLLTGEGPVLCDWDVAGPVAPRAELVDVALSMARWEQPDIARATVDAYRGAGGDFDAVTPRDVAPMLLSSIDWLVLNIERALGSNGTAREQRLGAELVPALLDRLAGRIHIARTVDRFFAS